MSERGLALITGAGSGIGRSVALALGREGYDVVAAGRRPEPLEVTARAIRKDGGRARAAVLDVTDADAVEALTTKLGSNDRLEVCVVNAGTFARGHVADLDPADWARQIDVNLTGAFLCVRAAIRVMREQPVRNGSRGHIFTMNSGAGVRAFPAGAAYAAAKHGLRGLVESARPDAAGSAIKLTDLIISATVESEMSFGRDVAMLPADTVGHTVLACLRLTGLANWDRVDLGQLPALDPRAGPSYSDRRQVTRDCPG